MNDTPPEAERKYREMLLQRSGADRLKMGCSMSATARALVIASILEKEPSASPARMREKLFLRVYGADFGADERGRIAAWLGRDKEERAASMTSMKAPVDWNDLEMALTANPGEWTCYLDVRSGEALMVPVDRPGDDPWPSEEELDTGLAGGRLIHIEPLGSSAEYGWMAEFASSVGDTRLRDRLEAALDGRGAFRRFKEVLLDHPTERERWFRFRDERLREAARRWLAEHDIEPTTAPPTRGHGVGGVGAP
jgi:uncharacterized protein UPF0158